MEVRGRGRSGTRGLGQVGAKGPGQVGNKGLGQVEDKGLGQVGDKGLGQVGDKGPGQVKDKGPGQVWDKGPGQNTNGVLGRRRGVSGQNNGDRFPLTEFGIRPPKPPPRAIIPRTECGPRAGKRRFRNGRDRRFGTGRVQGNVPQSDTGGVQRDRHRKMVTVCKLSIT